MGTLSHFPASAAFFFSSSRISRQPMHRALALRFSLVAGSLSPRLDDAEVDLSCKFDLFDVLDADLSGELEFEAGVPTFLRRPRLGFGNPSKGGTPCFQVPSFWRMGGFGAVGGEQQTVRAVRRWWTDY